jgi:hypothetical protein
MKLRTIVSLGLSAATCALTSITFADDQPDTAAREQAAVHVMSVANIVNDQDGHYRAARALAVDGPASLTSRTNDWLSEEQAWVSGWTKVLAFSDLKDDLSYSAFQDQLTKMLNAQSQIVVNMQADAAKLATLAVDAKATLGTPAPIPKYPETAQYQGIADALTQRRADLGSMIDTVAAIPGQKMARIAQIDDASRRAVVAHVKAALIAKAKYPLTQALNDVTALLNAEKLVDPALMRITSAFTQMNGYNAGLAYFHAAAAIGPARQDCANVNATLATLTAPASFVSASKAKVQNLCTGIEKLYGDVANDTTITHDQYVSAYLGGEKTKLPTVCANPSAGPACEKLALIASVSDADLAKMTDPQLALLELGWTAAMDRATGK